MVELAAKGSTGITKVEDIPGGMRIHYFLQKPWGVLDESGYRDILYNSIDTLDEQPDHVGLGENTTQEIDLSKVGKKVVFVFDSYHEKASGPKEHDIYGPFRPSTVPKDENQPMDPETDF